MDALDTERMASEPKPYKAGEELRRRLLEAASQLFGAEGYESVSVRQIARAAGCSQMAMYRHFPDKQALMRHLCVELYRKFTIDLHERFDALEDPAERICMALRHFVLLSAANPHHYRLIYLERVKEEASRAWRHEAMEEALSYIRANLRLTLGGEVTESLIEERVRLILAAVHGITVMLIMNPEAYGLNTESALRSLEQALQIHLH